MPSEILVSPALPPMVPPGDDALHLAFVDEKSVVSGHGLQLVAVG